MDRSGESKDGHHHDQRGRFAAQYEHSLGASFKAELQIVSCNKGDEIDESSTDYLDRLDESFRSAVEAVFEAMKGSAANDLHQCLRASSIVDPRLVHWIKESKATTVAAFAKHVARLDRGAAGTAPQPRLKVVQG